MDRIAGQNGQNGHLEPYGHADGHKANTPLRGCSPLCSPWPEEKGTGVNASKEDFETKEKTMSEDQMAKEDWRQRSLLQRRADGPASPRMRGAVSERR